MMTMIFFVIVYPLELIILTSVIYIRVNYINGPVGLIRFVVSVQLQNYFYLYFIIQVIICYYLIMLGKHHPHPHCFYIDQGRKLQNFETTGMQRIRFLKVGLKLRIRTNHRDDFSNLLQSIKT